MRLILDDTIYQLSLDKVIERTRSFYEQLSNAGVKTKDGKILRFGGQSLARTGIKALMTPIVIPFLNRMYAEHGLILDPPVKHTDLIDYSVNALLDYISITEKQLDVNFTSKTSANSVKTIESCTASFQEQLTIEEFTSKKSTEDD